MDGQGFDDLARRFATGISRRGLMRSGLGLLAAAAGARFGRQAEAASTRAPGEICRKDADCTTRTCGPKSATGRQYCLCLAPSDCPPPHAIDLCHLAACDAAGACGLAVLAGAPCDDGNHCTANEVCQADGRCGGGTPVDCDDGLACTDDACDKRTGCTHTLKAGFCLIDGVCVAQGARNPANPCQLCDTAQSTGAWRNVPKGTACDDATLCNGREACDGEGTCQPGVAVTCPPCQVCDPSTGACGADATKEGKSCAGTDPCFQTFSCQTGVCTGVSLACPSTACTGVALDCPAPAHGSATCADGVCGFACNTGFRACDGACIRSEVCCPATETCMTCATGAVACSGACVRCVGGEIGEGCACVCPSGTTLCRGDCVDLDTDSGNCGYCDHPCNGGVCSGGFCVCGGETCQQGETCFESLCSCCGIECGQAPDDGGPTPCGLGGCIQQQCKVGEICNTAIGACKCGNSEFSCGAFAGQTVVCVDSKCCQQCPAGEVTVVTNGTCGCTCGGGAGCGASGSCIDGVCKCGAGAACGSGEHCSFDLCCPSAQTNCGGACKDTSSDPHFCGGCIDCGSGATCSNYACVCSDGATPCPDLEHCTNGACECGTTGVSCEDFIHGFYCHFGGLCGRDPDPQLSAIGRR
jgi:hypothetical protein